MKISTKGTYAIEIVANLAMHSDEDHLESLKNIAARRHFSEKYLERIIKALRVGGIVRSVRGAHGGYCLAKQAQELTVTEVLGAVEGELTPVACLTEKTECGVDCDACPTRGTWGAMWKQILSVTDSVTIADIVSYRSKL